MSVSATMSFENTVELDSPNLSELDARAAKIFTVDPMREDLMRSLGIEFELRCVNVREEVQIANSWRNNARVGEQRHEATVTKYATDMRNLLAGHPRPKFPCPILKRVGDQYQTVAGNHRTDAVVTIGEPRMIAYVIVSGDDEAIEQLTVTDNNYNGLPPTEDERIQMALSQINANKATYSQAGVAFSVSPERLRLHDKANHVRSQITPSVGLDVASKLNMTALLGIAPLNFNDHLLARVATIAYEHDMTRESIDSLVTAVLDAPQRTDAGYDQAINRWMSIPTNVQPLRAGRGRPRASGSGSAAAPGPNTDRRRRSAFVSALERLDRAIPEDANSMTAVGVTTAEERRRVVSVIDTLIAKLNRVSQRVSRE